MVRDREYFGFQIYYFKYNTLQGSSCNYLELQAFTIIFKFIKFDVIINLY